MLLCVTYEFRHETYKRSHFAHHHFQLLCTAIVPFTPLFFVCCPQNLQYEMSAAAKPSKWVVICCPVAGKKTAKQVTNDVFVPAMKDKCADVPVEVIYTEHKVGPFLTSLVSSTQQNTSTLPSARSPQSSHSPHPTRIFFDRATPLNWQRNTVPLSAASLLWEAMVLSTK
jgi:hypothetical protein